MATLKTPAWAKVHVVQGAEVARLSLVDHAADVAAVAEALLRQPNTNARLARLAGRRRLDPPTVACLAALVAMHDVGKVNRGFQNKADPQARFRRGPVQPLLALLVGASGGREAVQRAQRAALSDALGVPTLLSWCGGHESLSALLEAVLAHHGDLPEPGVFEPDLWSARDGYDPMEEARRLGAVLPQWFPEAFRAGGEPLPSRPRFCHAFAGLVTLADWLGSDSDVFRFPGDVCAPDRNRDRMALARTWAEDVLVRRHLDPAARRTAAASRDLSFAGLFGVGWAPRPAQAVMAALDLPAYGEMVVLESETGSGKTEAALMHFLRLLAVGAVDGLYFALPTRAAAKQIQRRIYGSLKEILGDAAPPVGLAVPGMVRVDDTEGVPLPGLDVHWPDDADGAGGDRGWASERPKRYLAGAVMVGTIDQLLLGGLKVRHAHLRSGAMLRQLLVIDEVHASDAYMLALLAAVLDQHRAAGGHTLLMSATLGAAARARLTGGRRVRVPPLAAATAEPYPAVHRTAGAAPPVAAGGGPDKAVHVDLHEAVDDLDAPVGLALAAARAGARVLIIRNRVDDAVAVHRALAAADPGLLFSCAGVPAPHHARFAAEDRVRLDEALEAAFGRDAADGVGCIAATTQTAEQSLDLDADLMITDLCPADVLLQRIGRLHRHDRTRPAGCAAPRLIVVAPPVERMAALSDAAGQARGRLLGFGKVYPDLLSLAATRALLTCRPVWRIPAMNRAIVEEATHPEALAALAGRLGGRWPKHREAMWGMDAARRGVATTNAITWEDRLAPWPDRLDERVRTRLGLDSRQADLAASIAGPFGGPARSFAIPGWLAADVPADAPLEAVGRSADGAWRLRYGAVLLRYDATGLHRAEAPE